VLGALPPGVAAADQAVAAVWQRSDGPVAAGQRAGTWLWGPDIFASQREPYAEAPAGERHVYYFDKSRMEITDPRADRAGTWFVTNGLLARELVTGAIQVGHQDWQEGPPAMLPVVGDLLNNPDAPTYASFLMVASRAPGDNRAAARVGQPVTATLDAGGLIGTDDRLGRHSTIAAYSEALGHNIPDVFWTWLTTLDVGWEYVFGLPITEPYWVRARVGDVERDVLVQVYERRVLTFTPDNPSAWRVEMGNVGRHYHQWRHGR
jgi:hypothetical protein